VHFKLLRGENFSRFESFEYKFKRGSVGIFGPNGSGKSTILNAMYAVLTNDFGRFDGVKIDCKRTSAGKKDRSYLYAEVEHDGRLVKITRSLSPAASVLDTGDEEITDAKKIQPRLEEVLGITRDMLDLYVFKRQDRIFDFLTTTPAQRAEAYQALCRTGLCEDIWSHLGEFLNKDSDVRAEVADNSDELAQRIAALQARRAELEREYDVHKALLLNDTSLRAARAIVENRTRLEEARARLGELKETLDECESDEASRRDDYRAARKVREAAREAADETAAGYEAAKQALAGWKEYTRKKARLDQIADILRRVDDADTNEPDPPQGYAKSNPQKLHAEIANLERDLVEARTLVDKFREQALTACPTCGTPSSAFSDRVDLAASLVVDLPSRIRELKKLSKDCYDYEVALREWEAAEADRNARRRDLRREQKTLTEYLGNAPEGDEADLRLAVKRHEGRLAELEQATLRRDVAKNRYETASYRVETCRQDMARAEDRISVYEKKDARYDRAVARLAEHDDAQREMARVSGTLEAVAAQAEGLEAELAALRARLRRTKKARRLANVVAGARAVLHRDNLPRLVARHNLSLMEGDINAGLALFGSPFWVETDENLDFIAHKPGEPPHNAGRLSTGQSVVLAMAFWPAVGLLWAHDLGMLALDEPTANLDDDNRRYLSDAIGRLSARVRGRRQLFVVTHDHNLRGAFDQVIDLK
jgi:exonuclease SbcC